MIRYIHVCNTRNENALQGPAEGHTPNEGVIVIDPELNKEDSDTSEDCVVIGQKDSSDDCLVVGQEKVKPKQDHLPGTKIPMLPTSRKRQVVKNTQQRYQWYQKKKKRKSSSNTAQESQDSKRKSEESESSAYGCPICKETSSGKTDFINHVLSEHELVQCNFCRSPKPKLKKTELKKHIDMYHTARKCPICSKDLSQSRPLVHIKSHTFPYFENNCCPLCNFQGPNRSVVHKHATSHIINFCRICRGFPEFLVIIFFFIISIYQ